MRLILLITAALLLVPIGPLTAAGHETANGAPNTSVTVKEWTVPWAKSRPRDPAIGPDGRIWFVGQQGDYVAALDPGTGGFAKIDLAAGTGPHNVIVGDDGILWYAGNRGAHIGRIGADWKIRAIAMPDRAARDPHTLVFDGKGHIWFTVQGGNVIGRLAMASEKIDLLAVPTPAARPYGIAIAPDGMVWVALFGTHKLARIDPATLALSEHPLPRADARPRRIGVTSDGVVWYVDYAGGYLGALDPASGGIAEWPMPSGAAARPYGMAVDGRDRVWAVETGPAPNLLVGFDPEAKAFFSMTPIPSGAGAIRHMAYDAKTGRIWFGTDAGTIGTAQVVQVAPAE
ncbi:MAG: virginiamycin B lyase family protein [Pseudomonadota bacterium]